MKLEWRGYPVAQYQGDEASEYRGHHLEITRSSLWTGNGWTSKWDGFVDDECIASWCNTKTEAKKACIEYSDKQGDKP